MKNIKIDLISDTVTLPTDEMREAMKNAEVGDDVYQEDPTVNKLEELAAKKVGKERALFVSSGTMGNLIAVLIHCQRGEEMIIESRSHIYNYEAGGMSAVAGVMPWSITGDKGVLNLKDIKEALREENIHYSRVTLICLENTHNLAGGTIVSVQKTDEICQLAHQRNIPIHLDGARIFNAAIALNIEPTVLTKNVDSVMFCLSKGLCAPVGSILAGSREFIQKARKNRKLLGGGMRQAGILAAAGIIALEKMIKRLEEDHKNARILGEGLAKIEGIRVDLETVQTNMVYFDVKELVKKLDIDTNQFLKKLLDEFGIRGGSENPIQHTTEIRFVTHRGISREDIYATIDAIKIIAKNIN